MTAARADERIATLADEVIERGVRRVHVVARRDLDDPGAGGSERHADEFMRRWAAAGLDVVHRTARADGSPPTGARHGYRVVRRGGPVSVFPRTLVAELTRRDGRSDAFVEIWNGVPYFSPLWYHGPQVTVVHHVHGPMWDQLFAAPVATAGRRLESFVAPRVYRRRATVTPSEATRHELIDLGFDADVVTAVPNGVEPFWSPGGDRTPHPSLVAVGRLAPVKRFELVIRAAIEVRRTVPDLRCRIVGDGPERPALQQLIDDVGAGEWLTLEGYLPPDALRDAYRSAWLVVSGSLAEGWGLSLTEGAACGTPCVATDIAGHRSSVVDGITGLLATDDHLAATIARALGDRPLLDRLGARARARATTLTWSASAAGLLRVLRDEIVRVHRR